MAENGRAGQRFSQAPQPMQRSVFTAGIMGADGFLGLELTMVMAAVGQCRAQLPQALPSVIGMQFFFIHTAWPICILDLSSTLMGLIAPAGHASLQRVHSGRQ